MMSCRFKPNPPPAHLPSVHSFGKMDRYAWDCVQETFLEAVKIDRREPVRNWTALLRHLATARLAPNQHVERALRQRHRLVGGRRA